MHSAPAVRVCAYSVVMRKLAELALLLTLTGCASPPSANVLVSEHYDPPAAAWALPNLVLGPSVEHARLGEWYTLRSGWPETPIGVRLGEISEYSDVTYDDESYYDRFGGAFYRIRQSVRTGAVLR